jgi:tripartite-type tricarboxylate transporter receptor subunit TctC
MAAILAMPSTQDFIAKQGAEPFVSTPEETNAIVKQELARYGNVIKTAGVKFQP